MANSLAVDRYTPPGVPDTVEMTDTISGNYVAGGDALSLAPSAFKDPNGLGVVGYPDAVPVTPVQVDSNNAGGYYPEVIPAATLAGFKLKWYAPGGAEVGAGAYPAAIIAAQVKVRVPLK